MPKISIITPVFNGERYIESCIKSVLNQLDANFEYIVIDGGSTDKTVQIIKKYLDKITYFKSEKDSGQTEALNKGFAVAKGDIFGWLNADEEYLPDTLSYVENYFNNDKKLDFLYGNRIVVDQNKKELSKKKYIKMHPRWHLLYRMQVIPTDTSFWKASLHKKTGELDEKNFPQLSMDYDWLLRLSMNIQYWGKTNLYFSKFVVSETRKTAQAKSNILEKNSMISRKRVEKKYRISKIKIFFGWFIAGFYARIKLKKFFSIPNIKFSLKKLFHHQ
tara:strand:- start:3459 stop:4283 length:825 start_codon:yes stop_codon:yes gene_type:complete